MRIALRLWDLFLSPKRENKIEIIILIAVQLTDPLKTTKCKYILKFKVVVIRDFHGFRFNAGIFVKK